MDRVLVTGNYGFIGSELMKYIKPSGGIDLRGGKDLRNGIEGDYNIIVHLAAKMNNEPDMLTNNIESTQQVINYCKENNARLIFASSAAVYGDADYFPIKESDEIKPLNDYGKSKAICEEMITSELKDYVIFRLSNVYPKENSVYGRFLKGAPIYGDGKQVRDFIHVKTVCENIVKAINSNTTGIYNLSSGQGRTINSLYDELVSDERRYVEGEDEIRVSILSNEKWTSLIQ